MSSSTSARGQWGSKLGFVLAASGSAIGLGNIVFFGANAYRFGGGAFYIPYFVALLMVGLPMMIVEFGLGKSQGAAFPVALGRVSGKKGEFIGWFSLMNSIFIGMYYITILSWSASMLVRSFTDLYADGADSVGPTFGAVLGSFMPAGFVILIWGANILILLRGTKTIGKVVKVFVPLMWVFMIMLLFRGLTLENGLDGVWYLFTPNFEGIKSPQVWQGAFSQMFFSLSLGLGTMTAYASYLSKKSDVVSNSGMVSFLNCGFEYIAGIAIFTVLFAFTLNPSPTTGTLGMTLVVIPTGIAQFPGLQEAIAFSFFALLLVAGLTSSISIIESPVSAIVDKFKWSRAKALMAIAVVSIPGSIMFALPTMLQLDGADTQPLGISLLDLIDHWAFGYSLLIVGFVESIFVGWVYGAERFREKVNETARIKLGGFFDVTLKYIIPILLGGSLLFNVLGELGISLEALGISGGGFYQGTPGPFDGLSWLPLACFIFWLVATITFATVMTLTPSKASQGSDR